jgi:hypothetical protein
MPYPLISCSVVDLGKTDLFDWESPYHPHHYYDLTLDAIDIMNDDDKDVAELAFSKVKFWDPPIA